MWLRMGLKCLLFLDRPHDFTLVNIVGVLNYFFFLDELILFEVRMLSILHPFEAFARPQNKRWMFVVVLSV